MRQENEMKKTPSSVNEQSKTAATLNHSKTTGEASSPANPKRNETTLALNRRKFQSESKKKRKEKLFGVRCSMLLQFLKKESFQCVSVFPLLYVLFVCFEISCNSSFFYVKC